MFLSAWVQRKESQTKLKRNFACSAPISVCSQSKYSTRCEGLSGFSSRMRYCYIHFYLSSDYCHTIRGSVRMVLYQEGSKGSCSGPGKFCFLSALDSRRLPMTFLVPRLPFMETETSHLYLTILGCTLQWYKSLIFSPKPSLLKPIKKESASAHSSVVSSSKRLWCLCRIHLGCKDVTYKCLWLIPINMHVCHL